VKHTPKLAILLAGILAAGALVGACTSDDLQFASSMTAYRDRMLLEGPAFLDESGGAPLSPLRTRPVAQPANDEPRLAAQESLMTGPATTTQPTPQEIEKEIPDPDEAPAVFAKRLGRVREDAERRRDPRAANNYERTVTEAQKYLEKLSLAQKQTLTLAECTQRALEHNYDIRYEAYTPAISQTELVEAEAAFDATFFLDSSWSHLDQATATSLAPSKSDARSLTGGIRQLLPTGMQVSTSLATDRQFTDIQFVTLNPSYDSDFDVTFTQPLLKNFGLDVNRAQINIRRLDRRIAYETFIRQVRQTLFNVETAYWRLQQARGDVANQAESVAQNYVTWQSMLERAQHDATPVEIANSEARWRSRYVLFLESVKAVRDAEDALKNLLNDPELKLSDKVELIPIDPPYLAPLVLDHFAEVRTALDSRSEIAQARLAVEQARVNTMFAKNQTWPKLDLSFRYNVSGIGESSDDGFDSLTTNRFRSYTVSATFEVPFGNRAPRAALRRARMQESQAVVNLNRVADGVVQEVNEAIRTIMVRYEQIEPQLEAVRAAERNLRALQARAVDISPTYLETELNAVEQLANTRQTLLQVVAEYNIAVAALENAKGTLLEYNNIVVSDAPPER